MSPLWQSPNPALGRVGLISIEAVDAWLLCLECAAFAVVVVLVSLHFNRAVSSLDDDSLDSESLTSSILSSESSSESLTS